MYLHDMNSLDGNYMYSYCGDSVARLGGQILRCCILSGHFSFQGLSGRHLQLADPTLRADPEAGKCTWNGVPMVSKIIPMTNAPMPIQE